MKKNDKLHIPISTEQKEELIKKASDCGMSLSQYCLFLLIKARPKTENVPD